MKYLSRSQLKTPPIKYRLKFQPYSGLKLEYDTYQEALQVASRLIRYKAKGMEGYTNPEELVIIA